MNFIYVRSEDDKNRLLSLGYALVKEDKRNRIWVFQNKDAKTFVRNEEVAEAGVKFVLSNTLTF